MLISRFHEMNHCTSQISLLIPAMRSESSGGIAWDVISVAMCKYHQLINVDGIGQVSTGWGNSTFFIQDFRILGKQVKLQRAADTMHIQFLLYFHTTFWHIGSSD